MKTIQGRVSKYRYKNEQQEIMHHEQLKKASIYAYSGNQKDLPVDYKPLETIHNSSGFHAEVLTKGNEVVIAIRGTDKWSIKDALSDALMNSGKLPKQAKEAVELCERIKVEYPHADIYMTGHSAGGWH